VLQCTEKSQFVHQLRPAALAKAQESLPLGAMRVLQQPCTCSLTTLDLDFGPPTTTTTTTNL
jgi:hypothetical protein